MWVVTLIRGQPIQKVRLQVSYREYTGAAVLPGPPAGNDDGDNSEISD